MKTFYEPTPSGTKQLIRDFSKQTAFEKPDIMIDKADYEIQSQKDDQAERHFRNIDMLKEMRKDTPLKDFAEAIKEVLEPEELEIIVSHLLSKRVKQI